LSAPKSILIDCDPGIDDALALLLAFASPEIRIDAITTVYGNVALSKTFENLLRILKLAGVDPLPDIGKGAHSPLKGKRPEDRGVYGNDGLADVGLEASNVNIEIKDGVSLIIEKVLSGGIDSVLALGPLTNIATAVSREPEVKKRIKELIIMGGVLYPSGPFISEVEFNISCDPDAAKKVFHSKIPIKLVSLDVTRKVALKEKHLRPLEKIKSALADFVVKISKFSIAFNKTVRRREGMFLNDPLAVGIALNNALGSFKDLCIDVQLDKKRGQIFECRGTPNISFCNDVKANEFISLFMNRLTNYCGNYRG